MLRLSSQYALLIFHVAAREHNFTRAAETLNIGQSAVSHGVRQLEERLGIRLFIRQHQGVQLTAEGFQLARCLEQGFGAIQAGLEEVLQTRQQQQKVTLSVSTSLASHWLMPRITRFKQAYPDIQLHCITQDTDYDLNKIFDLCIPLGQVPWQGYRRWKFTYEAITPICSPAFLKKHKNFKQPKDLMGAPLIHLEERYAARFDWRQYFQYYNLGMQPTPYDSTYNDYSIVVQAAIEGQGLAIGWRHIVQPLLDEGRLLTPLDVDIQTDHNFYIIARETKPLSQAGMNLLEWLLGEIQQSLSQSNHKI